MIAENGDKKVLDGEMVFRLYDTFGFPVELTTELAAEKGLQVDMEDFERRFKAHQDNSRAGADQQFKGGLADHSEETTKLHTATHLLNAALKKVISPDINQKGSNITADRLTIKAPLVTVRRTPRNSRDDGNAVILPVAA